MTEGLDRYLIWVCNKPSKVISIDALYIQKKNINTPHCGFSALPIPLEHYISGISSFHLFITTDGPNTYTRYEVLMK